MQFQELAPTAGEEEWKQKHNLWNCIHAIFGLTPTVSDGTTRWSLNGPAFMMQKIWWRKIGGHLSITPVWVMDWILLCLCVCRGDPVEAGCGFLTGWSCWLSHTCSTSAKMKMLHWNKRAQTLTKEGIPKDGTALASAKPRFIHQKCQSKVWFITPKLLSRETHFMKLHTRCLCADVASRGSSNSAVTCNRWFLRAIHFSTHWSRSLSLHGLQLCDWAVVALRFLYFKIITLTADCSRSSRAEVS